eukprot:TRINITY_DN2726_c0_g1_i3.p2 TRINITY_DN2726_c0_g1~~TRINITY_DN2726_c0_g1_i3.p2  ORF type:complete len:107 (-),score=16.12 TRINITY_DN2726_c0_g1_i3:92-412(-)
MMPGSVLEWQWPIQSKNPKSHHDITKYDNYEVPAIPDGRTDPTRPRCTEVSQEEGQIQNHTETDTEIGTEIQDEDTQAPGILEVTDCGVQQRSRRGGADAEWGRVM